MDWCDICGCPQLVLLDGSHACITVQVSETLPGRPGQVWHDRDSWTALMTRNYNELRAKMSPDARARSEAKAKILLNEMALNELQTKITFRVFWRFLKCALFHKGSDVNHCDVCNQNYWKDNWRD